MLDASLFSVLPFCFLLFSIAVVPFINKKWWEKHYPYFPFGFAAITILIFLTSAEPLSRIGDALKDYTSFIILIASLFIVSGGILIRLKGRAKPGANTLLLLAGAIVSNIIGTTGASIVLIRPFLQVNKNRLQPYHVVFFIFIVSNIGGSLTPIGDPPLFLGYLMGVPFFWIFKNVWIIWLFSLTVLLVLFFVFDFIAMGNLKKREPNSFLHEFHEKAVVQGLHNIPFLLIIIAAVFIQEPKYVREAIMMCAAAGSYLTTKKEVHKENQFDFHPLREMAVLFFGIFVTMVPALEWLESHSATIGLSAPGHFYWAVGGLSSVLDNAPTYLNFIHASIGLHVKPETVETIQHVISMKRDSIAVMAPEIKNTIDVLMNNYRSDVVSGVVSVKDIQISYLLANKESYLKAISLAAVFFGAMTYIGNAPNFLIKSIAEHFEVNCPTFFGYILKYSLPILLPLFIVIWWIFFYS